jgi:F-type H+-transporting ATPase subunit b
MKIDWWTLGFQTVNVLVLMLLLRHFFWAPMSAMIARRQAAAAELQTVSAKQQADGDAAQAEIVKTRAGFAAERDAILASAHGEAERTRAALLDQAKIQVAALEAAARATIEAERAAMQHQSQIKSGTFGIDIARRLAGRLDGAAVHEAFLGWLVKAIAALPHAARQAAAAQPAPIEAISATTLTSEEQGSATTLIGKAFGQTVKLAFSVDPALIAGLELRAGHLVVSNSWRADLESVKEGVLF